MNNLDNAGFAPALMDVLARFKADEITEAEASTEIVALLNRWYTYTGTVAERMANFLLSISGFIVTTGTPSDAVGVDGEFALDNTNGLLYGPKAGGAWGSAILDIGGKDGRTILSGTGAPGSGVGEDGDFYYDTAASDFYGPKASGAWPAGVSLIGPKGDTGEVAVGTVTTLAPGESATVTNSGTSTDAVLDFGIPAGAAATVSVGTVSALTPGSTPTVTNSGSNAAAVLDFGLVSGAAATIAVGTVSTLNPGESATVTNSGTSAAAVFDIAIPKGDKGDTGDTGPQGALADDFQGAWDGGTPYAADDIVTYQGETWLALQGSTGTTPTEGATWTKLAAKGADGTGVGTVTSVAISGSDGIEIDSGSPITSSGTIALGVNKAALLAHINVEDGADVTDAANVAAAGARMSGTDIPLADLEQDGATDGQVLTWNNAAGAYEPQDASGGVTVAAIQTSAFTPAVGSAYPIDTSGGAITLTALPSSPTQGQRFELHDPLRVWNATNSVTVPGAAGINGRSKNQNLTLTGARVIFEYVNANYGWEMKVIEPKAKDTYTAPFTNTPSITAPANGATDIGETPTITSSAFGTTNGSDTHANTDWQIASDSGFSTIVVQAVDDASNKTSWTVPGGNLSVNTTYYVRARHSGATYGDSDWSETVSFTTAAQFLDPATEALIAQMSIAPTSAREGLIDALISGLKADGIWPKLERLWVMAAHDAQAARLDWKNPAGTALTPVNSPTFTADQGYAGDGSSAYLDTGFTLSTDAVQATKSSAFIGCWVRGQATANNAYYSGILTNANTRAFGFALRSSATEARTAATTSGTVLHSASTGFFANNQSALSAQETYTNGVAGNTGTITATDLPTDTLLLLAYRNNASGPASYADGQISVYCIGSSLTATEHANLYSRLNTYMAGL